MQEEATQKVYKKIIDLTTEKLVKINEKIQEATEKLNGKTLTELIGLIDTLDSEISKVNALNKVDEMAQLATFKTLIANTELAFNNLNNDDNKANPSINEKLLNLSAKLNIANNTYTSKFNELNLKKTKSENKYNEANTFAETYLNDAKTLSNKTVDQLETLLLNLKNAKEKAETSKHLAIANGYEKIRSNSETLEQKITNAFNNVKTEIDQTKELLQQIKEKNDAIDTEANKVNEDIKSKIDTFEKLINEIQKANTNAITFHNSNNIASNLLTKRPDVILAFSNLKSKTDNTTSTITNLNLKLISNKKEVEDALIDANDKESEKRASINAAKASKTIPKLTQALDDLKAIQTLAKNAKDLENEKGYELKKTEINTLYK